MTRIAERNRKITIRSWGATQGEGGGPVAVQTGSYTLWAKVEDRTGSFNTSEGQKTWGYDYKITVLYEPTRIIGSNMTVHYNGKWLVINSVSFNTEGTRKETILRCTGTDLAIDTAGNGASVPFTGYSFEYTGVGGENTWTENSLVGKTILLATKDGITYQVILFGTPTGKQVLYTVSDGTFLWSTDYEAGEFTSILYI